MNAHLNLANDKLGMWSPITASNDWCEENYDMTFYVAEFCEYQYIFPQNDFQCTGQFILNGQAAYTQAQYGSN